MQTSVYGLRLGLTLILTAFLIAISSVVVDLAMAAPVSMLEISAAARETMTSTDYNLTYEALDSYGNASIELLHHRNGMFLGYPARLCPLC